jgi:hypothetical protein
MRDYNTAKQYNKGYKSAPEVLFLALTLGYLVASLAWENIFKFFNF